MCLAIAAMAQPPQGFNYQAVLRNAEGQPLANQAVSIRLTLQGEDGNTQYYSEVHNPTTSPQGVVSVAVGSGSGSVGSLAEIPWSLGGVYLKVEVDPAGGTAYSLLGTTPLLAVPYALFATSGNEGPQGPEGPPGPEGPFVSGTTGQTLRHDGTSWVASSNLFNADVNVGVGTVTPSEKLEVAGNIKAQGRLIGQSVEVNQPLPEEEPIFVVRNSQNQVVFAVYEGGVRAYVDDTRKQTRGGFAIGGLSDQIKDQEGLHYFSLTPDSVRFNIYNPVDNGKQTRGGFAIGGLSDQIKGTVASDLLFIGPDSARIYIHDDPNKQTRGGFAIGGLSDQNKSQKLEYLRITPDSARISFHNDRGKQTRGGFAIGGLSDQIKGDGKNLMFVGIDSTRIYIDDELGKQTRGGFAIGGLSDQNKTLGSQFFNISPDASGTVESQPRILWYPLKNAFLAGQVKVEDPDSVGTNSTATGFESKAKGSQSQALGYKAIARGEYSTAIGKNALAHNTNSFAFGDGAKALNQDSYAFGAFVEAQGMGSFAFGYVGRDSLGPTGTVTKALGNYSFALGLGAQTGSTAEGAFAIGSGTTAQGPFSLAMGYSATSNNWYSTAIGANAQALEQSSLALGSNAYASKYNSIALRGYSDGENSITVGAYARSEGNSAMAIGGYKPPPPTIAIYRAQATGNRSLAVGYGVRALGNYSISIGNGNFGFNLPSNKGLANGDYSVAFGTSNVAGGIESYAIGNYGVSSASSSFAFGNTNTASGSYSFAIGNQNTASAGYSFAIGNNTTSTGQYATAMGRYTTAQAYNSFVVGRYNVIEGTTSSWNGYEPLFVVGNGSSTSDRRNAFTVRQDGLTEAGTTLRVTGWALPVSLTGGGIEIFYLSSSDATIQAYDRGTSTLLALKIPSTILSGHVRPATDNAFACGASSLKWTAVYAVNGTIQTSDKRMKDNILTLSEGLKTVLGLNPVSFTWRDKSDSKKHIGLIAQEVLPLVPEVVDTGDEENDTMGINYSGLVPVLIKAIQEQQDQIQSLQQHNAELEAKAKEIDNLKAELEAIKALLTK